MTSPRCVFLTGASGFLGRALSARFRAMGAEVRGVDLAAGAADGVVAGDISEPGAWQGAVDGCELVVHTAAVVSFGGDRRRFDRVNVAGTRRVIEAATRSGAARLVHLSTIAVFGFDFPDGVDETYPVACNGNPYVDTKIASERVALAAHAAGELPITVIRPGDVYGPGSRPWTVLPLQAIRARRMLLPAGGVFSPVYVDDLVEGVALAAAHPAAAGQVLTMTGGLGVPARDFFGRYASLLGRPPPPTLPLAAAMELARAAGAVERLVAGATEVGADTARYLARRGTYSIERARRLVGYAPAVGLDEGFERTAPWLRAQGLLD